MKIRFQADADLDPDIGRGLQRREPTIDYRAAQGYIADGTPDAEVLAVAADDGRVLVTRDVNSMPRHFRAFVRRRPSPGVVLVPATVTTGKAIERLLLAWTHWTPESIAGRILWLPDSPER